MHRNLYFVCPADSLEPVINRVFGGQNHFYTSLGNSVVFEKDTADQIKQLILKHNIQEISFVLAMSNPIISDALKNQVYADIRGLNDFYVNVLRQKGLSEVLAREYNRRFIILSYHLNEKIKELRRVLEESPANDLKIGGKIYNGQHKTFYKIYSPLVCSEYFSLN
nr:hypothetical protein [Allomuricauda sp.]